MGKAILLKMKGPWTEEIKGIEETRKKREEIKRRLKDGTMARI
ncbi:MAG: hypothetical protein WC157_03445 [Candidatus Paceibacterota bacterium]